MRILPPRLMILIVPLALLSGCGGGNNVVVHGKVAKAGSKYTPPQGHRVTITFYSIEAKDADGKAIKNEPFVATLDSDGETFKVLGREGYGIPPGSYRIAVTQKMEREAFEKTKPKAAKGQTPTTRETDFLDGKFSPVASQIVREIKSSGEIVVVDLDRPNG